LNGKDDVENKLGAAKVKFKVDTKKDLMAEKDDSESVTKNTNQVEDRAWRSKLVRYIISILQFAFCLQNQKGVSRVAHSSLI
jgi:hypothetical protein